ncbi:MAG TPA: DUF72 domain-containing protein [Vicinamibacterales bacterium]|nr:DUF72 domain-containing protein [Vicinamibacterales bacterium]
MTTLRIGTSGWNYPKGRGTWNGIFYPEKGATPRGFDELGFYAERFNTVEVNSTFYGQPRATVSLRWVKRTPPGFEFAVKLYQKFTHPNLVSDKTPVSAADVEAFKRGIEPLAAGARLGPLLAQFPASFKDTPEARAYIDWLLSTFRDYRVAVELRHRSWSDHAGEVARLLHSFGAAWTQIDEPKFRFSIRQDLLPNVRGFYYMRLHGRNAKHWWEHEQAEDRYNYLYSEEELRPIAEAVKTARALVKKQYVYLNNHFAAQAVADAAVLRRLLDEPVTAPMPAELVSRYPMLEGSVTTLHPSRLL